MSSSSKQPQYDILDDDYQHDVDVASEMAHNSRMIIAENQMYRPKTTNKQYKPKQEEFKKWCIETMKFPNGALVTDQKLAFFLKEHIMKNGNKLKKKQNIDDPPVPLGKETYLAYIKAMVDLYTEQKATGFNNEPHPRGTVVRTFLDTHVKKTAREKRDNFEDRGKNTLRDGYTTKELALLSTHFFKSNTINATRDRLCFLMSHAMLLRSENCLQMQLPDLFTLELEDQGVSKCIAAVATITFGKTNKDGKIQYGSALRHSDCEVCPIGAFAFYFFSLYHHENKTFPTFEKRSDWYNTFLFPGDKLNSHLTYEEQAKIYRKAFQAVNINSSKVTHINRKSAINMIAHKGVPGDQQRQVGRWGSDRMVGCYLSGLPVQAVKVLAGFTTRHGDYFLSRAAINPPELLKMKLFPKIEEWKQKFANKEVEEDIAGPNFLEFLSFLRVVLLQDSVIMKHKYPDHYLWINPIFSLPEYRNFEQQLLSTVAKNNEQFTLSQHLEVLVPEIAAAMKQGFNTMSTSVLALQAQTQSNTQQILASNTETRNLLADALCQAADQLRNSSNSQGSNTSRAVPVIETSIQNPILESSNINRITGDIYQYKMNRNIVSVTDAWREYSVGINGGPSIKRLEENYKTGWRKNRTESRFFSNRLVLYKEIEKMAREGPLSFVEAAERLEERKQDQNYSIDKLIKVLKQE